MAKILLRMSDELLAQVDARAKEEGTNRSEVIRRACAAYGRQITFTLNPAQVEELRRGFEERLAVIVPGKAISIP